MICSGRDKIETPEQVFNFTISNALIKSLGLLMRLSCFQFQEAQETVKKLDLDGLVVIGGDDSNTNACLLAENFRFVMLCICSKQVK